ncbi:MAG: alpha-L-rhamnosidase [Cyclobacteriaceae bacterium]
MKSYLILFLLTIIGYSSLAQLPPVFGSEYDGKSVDSEMVKTYLTPQKILWLSDESGKFIKNPEQLLKQDNGQVGVADKSFCRLSSTDNYRPSLLLDYGKEINGGVKISMGIRKDKNPVKLRLRFGESADEAMSDIQAETTATNDHSIRDFVIEVPWLGTVEIGETGYRFLRIDVVEAKEDIPLKSVEAAFIYRDIPYLGSFKCDDDRLNEIWSVGAYTVHLNMQTYLWDGIKRDRLVWIGDMHPEVMTINSVFGQHDIVKKSLDLARDQYPLPAWMNGISSYSMWWLLIHKNIYDYHGDLAYLKEQEKYLIGLLDQFITFIDDKNKEKLDGHRFLDWPTSEYPEAVHAGLQAMMIMTFEAGSEMMGILGKPELQEKYSATVARLKKYKIKDNETKQASALMVLAGIKDAKKTNEEVLKKDGVERMSTFYGYYILEAMAKAGDYNGALKTIRDYWGGMLDLGATTFWEDFDITDTRNSGRIDEFTPPNKDNIHADFGEYCYVGYRHSFCHGWASGPTSWLSQHVLGVNVLEGGDKVKISPKLGDLEWVEGSFPTKHGVLKIKHKKNSDGSIKTDVDAPKGLTVLK